MTMPEKRVMSGAPHLLPGDLFLATGRFQELLVHRTLPFSEAADVAKVLNGYPAVCKRSKEVFSGVEYLKYFDKAGACCQTDL